MIGERRTQTRFSLACPAAASGKDTVLLGHGSGGKLSADLIRDVFLPAFQNPILARLDDQAIVSVNGVSAWPSPRIRSSSSRCSFPAATSVRWPCTAR